MRIILLLLASVILILSSCTSDVGKAKTPEEAAEETIKNVVSCFETKDKETLKSYFSEAIREEYDLDVQIEAAFEFIDGDILSYGDPVTRAGGPTSDKSYGAYYDDVTTANGTTYKIDFMGKYRYDADPKRNGIKGIRVINMSAVALIEEESEKEEYFFYIGDYS